MSKIEEFILRHIEVHDLVVLSLAKNSNQEEFLILFSTADKFLLLSSIVLFTPPIFFYPN